MANDAVVVASFMGLGEAEVARGNLEAQGIDAWLEGEQLIGVAWHLSNAVGGVKLVVPAADAERARAALNEPAVPAESGDEDQEEAGPADALATKAWQSSLLGFLLLPPLLHLWSVWLLVQSTRAGGPRTDLGRRHAFRAAVADVLVLSIAGAVVARFLIGR